MFAMTAAHPTLPIPSYARVTSLETGRQVIVKVNDRGPFLSNRIIDLSYTAAFKLGYLNKGSGQVQVELLLPDEIERINLCQKQCLFTYRQTGSRRKSSCPADKNGCRGQCGKTGFKTGQQGFYRGTGILFTARGLSGSQQRAILSDEICLEYVP